MPFLLQLGPKHFVNVLDGKYRKICQILGNSGLEFDKKKCYHYCSIFFKHCKVNIFYVFFLNIFVNFIDYFLNPNAA